MISVSYKGLPSEREVDSAVVKNSPRADRVCLQGVADVSMCGCRQVVGKKQHDREDRRYYIISAS
jgi:hypothetical protein